MSTEYMRIKCPECGKESEVIWNNYDTKSSECVGAGPGCGCDFDHAEYALERRIATQEDVDRTCVKGVALMSLVSRHMGRPRHS
mgnify:CR=1 FL=1